MRVLIYAPLAVLGHHFETDLEIAETHLLKGDDVYLIECNGALKPLQFMACEGFLRCKLCTSKSKSGTQLLSSSGKFTRVKLGDVVPADWISDQDLTQIEGIKKLNYRECDLGSAYMSSLISALRDSSPEMGPKVDETKRALNFMAGLTNKFDEVLSVIKPDVVYMFNGRFSLYRPLLRLCQNKKIECYVHERASSQNKYFLTPNNMPHDQRTLNGLLLAAWKDPALSQEEKKEIASQWYEKNLKGNVGAWLSFVDDQDVSKLPSNWNAQKRNFSVFVSSDDEFMSVPGWELPFFQSQKKALDFILKSFNTRSDVHFYVRIHPNLRGLKNKSIQELMRLDSEYENCTVIPAESPVSTYKLMFETEKTISFGSTVGVEATYWGRPSLLLGKSFYGPLKAAYVPSEVNQIIQLLEDKDLKAAPKEGAYLYGYWMATFGTTFRYYETKSLTGGLFKGVSITGNKFYLFVNYLSVAIKDLIKIYKGEYGMWHFKKKLSSKLSLYRSLIKK